MGPIPVALLALVTMLLAGPAREAAAQPSPGKVYRVGLLSQGQPPRAYMEALQNGLKERGYVEGRNLAWERRSTDGSLDQLAQFAEELVSETVWIRMFLPQDSDSRNKGAIGVIIYSDPADDGYAQGIAGIRRFLFPRQLV